MTTYELHELVSATKDIYIYIYSNVKTDIELQ
jgi:hypothetical protein